jgi:selenocysteine-specific translation elongation factor
MNHLTVGVFHDDTLNPELGKKGTESDLAMFNRKMGEEIFTFMSPVGDKLVAKSEIISSIDVAIVAFPEMTRELGETLVMLDLLGVANGIAVTSPYATRDRIAGIIKDTSLKSFMVEERDPIKLIELLKNYRPKRDTTSPALVVVDHSFSVKGVGEVILGFVKRGVVRKYDKLTLFPANKEVLVRSIQMQDEDYDEAEAGSRVGLAVKGATVEEMKRGSVLCAPGGALTGTSLKLSFKKSPFYSDELSEGTFHATVDMQTVPITISDVSASSIVIESEKPIAYTPNDTFLLLNLNAKKMRVIGKGWMGQV